MPGDVQESSRVLLPGSAGGKVCSKKTVIASLSEHPASHVLEVISDEACSLESVCCDIACCQFVFPSYYDSWWSGSWTVLHALSALGDETTDRVATGMPIFKACMLGRRLTSSFVVPKRAATNVTLHHEMSRNVPIYFCSSMEFTAGV